MRFLIVYGTRRGQTAKIANAIGHTLRDAGEEARVVDGSELPLDLEVAAYDALIVGASVYSGRFQPFIATFIKQHRADLDRMPSAFFAVSLTEADPDPRRHARALTTIGRLMQETGWQPDRVASFAGSIGYLRHRWLMRLIRRWLPLPSTQPARQPAGAPPVYEYTDWDAVSRFTAEFAELAHATLETPLSA